MLVGTAVLMPVMPLLMLIALPRLQPFDRQTGGAMVAALLQVPAARLRPERVVGVGDLVALAVRQDVGGGLPPGAGP